MLFFPHFPHIIRGGGLAEERGERIPRDWELPETPEAGERTMGHGRPEGVAITPSTHR